MIKLFKINSDKKDEEAIIKVLRRKELWTTGGEADELEKKIAKYTGSKYAVVCNSGTSGLHAALIALGIGEGDEVIIPSFSFQATANVVLMVGATPVFADIEEGTYGLDPEDVLQKITDKTKAVIPVHVAGKPCKIEELKRISDDYSLFLIEDACEGLGATIGSKMVGTFGDIGVYSFCQNKLITTGDGGAIVTDNQDLYRILKLLVSHGREGNEYVDIGYNFRLPNILAALGLSQLNKIDENIKARTKIAEYYDYKFDGYTGYINGQTNTHQLYIRNFGDKRDKIKSHLDKLGIGNKVYFEPIHKTKFYKELGYGNVKLPITEKISKQVLALPIYPGLSVRNQNIVIKEVLKAQGINNGK